MLRANARYFQALQPSGWMSGCREGGREKIITGKRKPIIEEEWQTSKQLCICFRHAEDVATLKAL